MSETRETYYLTDGIDTAREQMMTEEEAREENERRDRHTAGTWRWCKSPGADQEED